MELLEDSDLDAEGVREEVQELLGVSVKRVRAISSLPGVHATGAGYEGRFRVKPYVVELEDEEAARLNGQHGKMRWIRPLTVLQRLRDHRDPESIEILSHTFHILSDLHRYLHQAPTVRAWGQAGVTG